VIQPQINKTKELVDFFALKINNVKAKMSKLDENIEGFEQKYSEDNSNDLASLYEQKLLLEKQKGMLNMKFTTL